MRNLNFPSSRLSDTTTFLYILSATTYLIPPRLKRTQLPTTHSRLPAPLQLRGNEGLEDGEPDGVVQTGRAAAGRAAGLETARGTESVQHGLAVPQNGPAAHAVQPRYSSFDDM